MPTLAVDTLTHFCEDILKGAGVPRHKAEIAAACLVASNLRGVDSHGIQLLPFYIDQILASELDPFADGRVLSEALVNGKAPAGTPKTETTKASADVGLRHWEQYLKTTTFGGAFYVDEGNGISKLRE